MRVKNILLVVISLMMIFASLQAALAITGALGNSRMVLRMAPGETLDKSLLVKNVNNETIRIEISVSGDLNNSLRITNTNFSIPAGQDKKVDFSITAPRKAGTNETKLNVKFAGSSGSIGLSATIITIVDSNSTGSSGSSGSSSTSGNKNTTTSTGSTGSGNENSQTGQGTVNSNLPSLILIIITPIALIVILILLLVYMNKNRKKEVVHQESITKSKKSKINE